MVNDKRKLSLQRRKPEAISAMTVIPSKARNLMGLLRLGLQLRLRVVYTEQRECARNDDYMSPYLNVYYSRLCWGKICLEGTDESIRI